MIKCNWIHSNCDLVNACWQSCCKLFREYFFNRNDSVQCDQIWGKPCYLGTFWMPRHFYGGGQQFGLLLLHHFFLHFHLNKQVLKFQNQPDVDVMDFQIELWCRYFMAQLLFWLLFTKFGNFFNLLVTHWIHLKCFKQMTF